MDAKMTGSTIAALRKGRGFTQAELAARLNVSGKTVSKWESGLGYPEITQFPALASLFGVSIDYLMTGLRKGVAIAGNILTDQVKSIDCYPEKGMLANISEVTRSVGGCVPNTGIDLAKIDPGIPIAALGCIGDDEGGRYVISELQRNGIDTHGIRVSTEYPTSFSDVMSLPSGERTFFHARGANAVFAPEDVDLDSLTCSLFHIGYLLLLDQFDREDETYGTAMAGFLHTLQQKGIKTSIDVVSDSSADYYRSIAPVLPYCTYAVMNEIEACSIWGLEPRKADGTVDQDHIRTAMEKMIEAGVKEKAIVHCKECGFCLDASGTFTVVPSLKIPKEEIRGSVGAGDAFCAGCLYGFYRNFSDREILEFASASAACSLFAENSVDSMKSKTEILKLAEKYGR